MAAAPANPDKKAATPQADGRHEIQLRCRSNDPDVVLRCLDKHPLTRITLEELAEVLNDLAAESATPVRSAGRERCVAYLPTLDSAELPTLRPPSMTSTAA